MDARPLPVRLSGSVLRVNGGCYNGYGGAGEEGKGKAVTIKSLRIALPLQCLGTVKNRGLDEPARVAIPSHKRIRERLRRGAAQSRRRAHASVRGRRKGRHTMLLVGLRVRSAKWADVREFPASLQPCGSNRRRASKPSSTCQKSPPEKGRVTRGFLSHLRSLRATMSQKSSVPQAVSFVSQVLKRDTAQSMIFLPSKVT